MSTPPSVRISVECPQGTWTHDEANQKSRYKGEVKITGRHPSCPGAPMFSFTSHADLDVPIPDFYRHVPPIPVVALPSDSSSSSGSSSGSYMPSSPWHGIGVGPSYVAPPSTSVPPTAVAPMTTAASDSPSLPSEYREPTPFWRMPTYADGLDTNEEIPMFPPLESLPQASPPSLIILSDDDSDDDDPSEDPDYHI